MINSRKIEDLHPKVADKANNFIAVCKGEGIDLLITSTYRDNEAQHALFLQRPIVTKADAGQSMHNYQVAFDVVPLRNGKPVWNNKSIEDAKLWRRVGELGEQCGLEWSGRWVRFPELAHFQYTGGLKLEDFQAGKVLP